MRLKQHHICTDKQGVHTSPFCFSPLSEMRTRKTQKHIFILKSKGKKLNTITDLMYEFKQKIPLFKRKFYK